MHDGGKNQKLWKINQISHVEGKYMNELKLANQMLTTHFQTMKLVIHVAKMQQIMFFVHNMLHFRNMDDDLHCFEMRSQHTICKLESPST